MLAWIQNEKKRYKQFIQNCVKEFKDFTQTDMLYHFPGKENIADLTSRGCLSCHQSGKVGSMVEVGCYRIFQLGKYLKISINLQTKKKTNLMIQSLKNQQFQQ